MAKHSVLRDRVSKNNVEWFDYARSNVEVAKLEITEMSKLRRSNDSVFAEFNTTFLCYGCIVETKL